MRWAEACAEGAISAFPVKSEGEGELVGRSGRRGLAPGQQVAFDQGEEVRAQFVGQRFVVPGPAGPVAGREVCFCFHRP